MPAVLKCAGCGRVLERWATMPSPGYYEDLYRNLNGRCPSCGHELPQPRELSGQIRIEMKGVSS